jgi:predicted phage-related endonuclease
MGILGLRKGWLACYISNRSRDFYVVEVDFDQEWFHEMADEAERFWVANILGDDPPMHDFRHPRTEELLKQIHPVVVRPSVDLPENADEWLRDYWLAKVAAEKANADLDAARNFFRMWTGDAGAGYLGERKVVSYPVVNTSRIDVEALKRDFPEVAEKVTVRSSYRRLTITVPKEMRG